ncbi:uncharacterized protein [Venturia canescens]|uniref:uncharacterized protein isoform X2 n=1 Tax=Venturia canescens TaxID=32260 RepID=UPI001C9C0A6B|nr:uncharacterized protein LOC122413649 isoform X2 [Venturia canescens]
MPIAKRSFEEERASLLTNEECFDPSPRDRDPSFETAVLKGVSNHVEKWPAHLFASFLAASLVFAAFFLFALVTALFCVPSQAYRCRRTRSVDLTEFPNIYFVKHENRTWSRKELCYMESSARENPDTSIYLINLLTDVPDENGLYPMTNGRFGKTPKSTVEMSEVLVFWEKTTHPKDNFPRNVTGEAKLRLKLGARYTNVRNVDVTLQDIFRGSILSNVFRQFDARTSESAAKANILWNSPGIALDAADFPHIRQAKHYLCKHECKLIKNATINQAASFQAAGVHCHAFIGCLMRQMASLSTFGIDVIVRTARKDFCQRNFLHFPALSSAQD